MLKRICLTLLLLQGIPVMAIEEPAYQLVSQVDAFEVRDYPAYLVAETRVRADFGEAGNLAFRPLFNYISGNNRSQAKIAMTAPVTQAAGEEIAMTAPVTQTAAGADGHVVSFTMPASFTRATLPEPLDPAVVIREVAPRRMAVLKFSGTWSQARYAAHEAQLLQRVQQAGLAVRGRPEFARYNAPFVPWFLRRNEVMVEVARLP